MALARPTTGREIGTQIAEALGLDPRTVVHLELKCDVQGAAMVEVARLVSTDEASAVRQVLEQYELTNREVLAAILKPSVVSGGEALIPLTGDVDDILDASLEVRARRMMNARG